MLHGRGRERRRHPELDVQLVLQQAPMPAMVLAQGRRQHRDPRRQELGLLSQLAACGRPGQGGPQATQGSGLAVPRFFIK